MVTLAFVWKAARWLGEKGGRVFKVYPVGLLIFLNHMKLLCVNTWLTLEQCVGGRLGALTPCIVKNLQITSHSLTT